MRVLSRFLYAVALPCLLALGWWFASRGSQNFFFPPLSGILSAFADVWFSAKIVEDVLPSVLRLASGYLIAAGMGLALGVPIGLSTRLRAYVEPVLEFLRAIPPPVLVPILILFAGIGTTMKLMVIVSGCLWPVLLNTIEGVRGLDETLGATTRAYRFTRRGRLVHFILPGAAPLIFAGLRQSLSIGIILMVISEMFAASNGIGFTIVQFQRSFAIPEMWSGIILLGLVGFIFASVLGFVERRVLHWYFGLRAAERNDT
ncbi:ABC transporter permease [Pararhizobium mangrovi]|uniref:ABC transporter permease n=1 Tax=Pararhizobium mangrovi TaxID=2590452 RepID=A0A506U7L7_9HYPH|nr:ABC transporter permease [Pararhizobium mangrovi]TPW30412.1 ABC transporter permease [Pararhizobium mangrovi]